MFPTVQARLHTIPTTTLLQRLEWCQKDEAKFFRELDTGDFPGRVPADSKPLAELDDKVSFRFVKWLYRSSGSDLALVELPNHPLSVLKIVSWDTSEGTHELTFSAQASSLIQGREGRLRTSTVLQCAIICPELLRMEEGYTQGFCKR